MQLKEVFPVESKDSPIIGNRKHHYRIVWIAPIGVASFIGGEHIEA
jgi:hypothetical protein